jgi:hypothetical protein
MFFSFKRLLVLPSLLVALLYGCSYDGVSSGTPQTPPLPRTESILPLTVGHQWTYSSNRYDSAGTVSHEGTLNLSLPGVYGVRATDSVVVRLNQNNYNEYSPHFMEYLYEYEWEEYKSGYLLAYRDIDIDTPGLYIVGTYQNTRPQLYAKGILWLAYPAEKGFSWSFSYPGTTDTINMQVMETDTTWYHHNLVSAAPASLRFYHCYLYRESLGDSSSQYFYNEDVGALAWFRFYRDSLVRAYTLTRFDQYYNYY